VDHQLILSLLEYLVDEPQGGVLVFLPGYEDIMTLRSSHYLHTSTHKVTLRTGTVLSTKRSRIWSVEGPHPDAKVEYKA